MTTLIIVLFVLVAAIILIAELIKQAQEIDTLHMIIEQDEREIRIYKQQLAGWKGNLDEVTYNGDLFIKGSLHTGKNGCMVIDGSCTYCISESGYSDEWLDACLEAPNIITDDLDLEGKLVIVHGDVFVWLEAEKDPGDGFIACSACTPHIVLDASHRGRGGSKS